MLDILIFEKRRKYNTFHWGQKVNGSPSQDGKKVALF
jgi:hypothetical protein